MFSVPPLTSALTCITWLSEIPVETSAMGIQNLVCQASNDGLVTGNVIQSVTDSYLALSLLNQFAVGTF